MSQHPNAWLILSSRFGELLDAVYRQHRGEIWLFNNDLYVLEHPHLFQEVYRDMLDKEPIRTKVRAIKMLLTPERLARVKDPKGAVQRNLRTLSLQRLRTMYVGSLESAGADLQQISSAAFGEHPWIFYTVEGNLVTDAAAKGIVLVRHHEYPFAVSANPDEAQFAVGWRVRDQSSETAHIRARVANIFDSLFTDLRRFESLEPIVADGRVKALKFIKPRTPEEIDQIIASMPGGDTSRRTAVQHVDFGVVTALEDEAREIESCLEDSWQETRSNQLYRVGYYRNDTGRVFWIAVVRHARMGSVPSALATSALIRDFDPRFVVLLGIAGGRQPPIELAIENRQNVPGASELERGDVVFASAVSPYEYEKVILEHAPNGEWVSRRLREDRTLDCSPFLFQLGERVAAKWNASPPALAERPSDAGRESLRVHGGVIASGCKVLADETALQKIDSEKPFNRKMIAIEMEGEGVAEACRMANREFLVIKGISDLADRVKNDVWRLYAARASARFFIDMLEALPDGHP